MKSPWKFLAQLTSRRPTAQAQESSVGNDTESKTLESELEDTSALPPSSAIADGPPARDVDISVDQGAVVTDEAKGDDEAAQALKPPINAEEAQATARHEADHSGAEASSLVPKSPAKTKSQSKPRTKRRERGKGANADMAAQSAVAPKQQKSLEPSSSRDLFFYEVATLDDEIKMLRTELAQKLHLQNVQLKRMLERFDVS